jgi:hypothetical protein
MRKLEQTVDFRDEKCNVFIGKYAQNKDLKSIQLKTVEDGSPMALATLNIDVPCDSDEVFIKNYSENKGILETLIEAGIISKPFAKIRLAQWEESVAYQCKLLK